MTEGGKSQNFSSAIFYLPAQAPGERTQTHLLSRKGKFLVVHVRQKTLRRPALKDRMCSTHLVWNLSLLCTISQDYFWKIIARFPYMFKNKICIYYQIYSPSLASNPCFSAQLCLLDNGWFLVIPTALSLLRSQMHMLSCHKRGMSAFGLSAFGVPNRTLFFKEAPQSLMQTECSKQVKT